MARYIQNAHMGSISPDEYADFRTIFHGASEAPRVHGMLGDKFDSLPRFKNHYFVAFQYTDLNKSSVNPKTIIDVMHRIKSVDAPKFEIETETLNQYNKPRIIPTKITYQPITITFHDDKSNYTTDFWRRIYQFYFLNGQRISESQYNTRDSDLVVDESGSALYPNYNNYGYYIDNKVNKKNLFLSMSLYMLQNRMCTRMDLVNPQLQSMQHDQFSQEMSNELAQNTTMWGYENVVYYSSRSMDSEQTLRAFNYSEGDPAIFQSSPRNLDPDGQPYRETYAHTATGASTAPEGNKGDFSNDAGFGDDMGAEDEIAEGGFDYSESAQPKYVMATKPPQMGFIPKSGLDSKISHFYKALASGREDLLLNPIEAAAAAAADAAAAANVDDFSGHTKFGDQQAAKNVDTFGETNVGHVDDFSAAPEDDPYGTTTTDEAQTISAESAAVEIARIEAEGEADIAACEADPWCNTDHARNRAQSKLGMAKKKYENAGINTTTNPVSGNRQAVLNAANTTTQNKDPAKWTDPGSGKVYVVSTGKNKGGTAASIQQRAVDNYWAMSPTERKAADQARATRQKNKEDNADK